MIPGYEPPQLVIDQSLQVVTNPASLTRSAFIFGPQFDLFRYLKPAERAKMKGAAFVRNTSLDPNARQVVPYEGLLPTHIVDQLYTRLYGENLEGQYWTAASHVNDSDPQLYDFQLLSLAQPNKLQVIRRGAVINAVYQSYSGQITSATVVFGGSGYPVSTTVDVPVTGSSTGTGAIIRMVTNGAGVVISASAVSPGSNYTSTVEFTAPVPALGANVGVADATLIPDLYGRPVQANDVLYLTQGASTVRRTVRSVERQLSPASFGTDANNSNGNFAASPNNPSETDAASFTNTAGPANWGLVRNHASLLPPVIAATGTGKYDPVQTALVVSAPIAVANATPWPTQQASGTLTIVGGQLVAVNLTDNGAGYFHGAVVGFVMTNAGAGYALNNPPVVTVTAAPAGGINAVIAAVVKVDGTLTLNILEPGQGYTTKPTITITGGNPVTPATATALLTNGVVGVTMTNPGSGYTSAPTVTFSSPGNTGAVLATGYAIINNGAVIQVVITNTGYGYTVGPLATVAFSGGGGTSAAGTCVMGTAPVLNVAAVNAVNPTLATDLGSLTAKVTSHPEDWSGLVQGSLYNGQYGERYTLTVTTGGLGSAARLRIRSASSGFTADNVTPTQEGFGYVVNHPALGGLVVELMPPSATSPLILGQTFTFVIVGKYKPLELSMQGQVLALNIAAGGSGYGSSVTVALSAPPPGGVQATATITESGGVLNAYTITNPGSGYLSPPLVTLANTGGGTGAILNAIIASPVNSRDLTLVPGGSYSGPVNNQYRLTVVKGDNLGNTQNSFTGAVVRVNDTAGVDAPVTLNVTEGAVYPLGTSGLSFTFPANLVGPSGLSVGTTATGTATVASTALASVAVTSGGTGYVVPPAVSVVGGGGSGAVVQAAIANGVVVDLIVVSGGTGYVSTPTIVVAAPVSYQGGLRTGDVYFLNVVAPAPTGPASVIVLSGQLTDITGWTNDDLPVNLFNIDARVVYSGVLTPQRDTAPTLAWTAGTALDGGILVQPNLNLQLVDRTTGNQWVPVQNSPNARLFASWRGLVPSLVTDTITTYSSESDILAKYGQNDVDNPICYGALVALAFAQGNPIMAMSLPTNDVAGYAAVLKQAARVLGPTYLAPMTSDVAAQALLPVHVDACSADTVKLWRRSYLNVPSPGPYALITEDASGNPLLATVTANLGGNVRVHCPGANFITRDVLPGDLFRTSLTQDAWGNPAFAQYPVLEVLEEDELLLASGPAAPINPAIQCQIWRADTGHSQALFAGNRSTSYGDRRVMNLWCDSQQITDANDAVVPWPLYYLAAAYAGLRSAVLPQQGLSLTPLQFSGLAAPAMFTKYSAEDLNLAASMGTCVIAQDQPDGPVYIRHQLTTDTTHGILYYEDGVGVNLDDIAYRVQALLAPYPGRRNATSETVEELDTKLRGLFDSLKQLPSNQLNPIGSQIVNYANLVVALDPNFADRINTSVQLEIPTPLNRLLVNLIGTTTQAGTTVSATVVAATAQ